MYENRYKFIFYILDKMISKEYLVIGTYMIIMICMKFLMMWKAVIHPLMFTTAGYNHCVKVYGIKDDGKYYVKEFMILDKCIVKNGKLII